MVLSTLRFGHHQDISCKRREINWPVHLHIVEAFKLIFSYIFYDKHGRWIYHQWMLWESQMSIPPNLCSRTHGTRWAKQSEAILTPWRNFREMSSWKSLGALLWCLVGDVFFKHPYENIISWKSKTKQRMVFKMIHAKDSLLPMGKVWSWGFLGYWYSSIGSWNQRDRGWKWKMFETTN